MINFISKKYYDLKAFIKSTLFDKCVSKDCKNKATHTLEIETENMYVKRHLCEMHFNMVSKILSK